MSGNYSETTYVRLPEKMLILIDEYRSKQRPMSNRSEAIRQLIEAGLTAKGYTAP